MEVPCNPLYLTILIVIATHLRLWLIIGVQVYMAKFGRSSRERLATCDERLQKLFNEVPNLYATENSEKDIDPQIIDILIDFYVSLEQYEKCQKLVTLKEALFQ